MALRFVLDENQRGLLWRAIVRHNQLGVYPVDVVRVGDPPDLPLGASDPEVLLWCEREDRILVSFDKSTLAGHLAGIKSAADLAGKTLVLGSKEAAEATVLPLHYLKKEGVALDKVRYLRLDDELDLRGNPCSSPQHVLKALQAGRADAGIVGERLWNELMARKAPEAAGLQTVWTSPAFSHCVFTAAKDFDKTLAARFTRVMLAMDGKDACSAEILRLEAAKKWVAGSPEGFETLIEALRANRSKAPGGNGRAER